MRPVGLLGELISTQRVRSVMAAAMVLMRSAAPTSLSSAAPDGIVEVWVDPVQGLQVVEPCDGVVRMPYVRGSEPQTGSFCGYAIPEETVESMDDGQGTRLKGWLKGWLKR